MAAMTDRGGTSPGVRRYYGQAAANYHEHYDPARLHTIDEYPANYFRLQLLLARLNELGCTRLADIGCGEGTPLVQIAARGIDVWGCDYTPEMVSAAKANFGANGLDPERLSVGDITDRASLAGVAAGAPYDAAICFGVMPHVPDNRPALEVLRSLLAPGGRAFVEFRNKLFGLFTMNRFTHDLVVNDLLADVPDDVRTAAGADLAQRVAMNQPPVRAAADNGGIDYDRTGAKFDNPLQAEALFRSAGFNAARLHWYHFHPAPPMLDRATIAPERYRAAAIDMEPNTDDWRGHFLCSAYVVEATA